MYSSTTNFIQHPSRYFCLSSYEHNYHQHRFDTLHDSYALSTTPDSILSQTYNSHDMEWNVSSQSNTVLHSSSDNEEDDCQKKIRSLTDDRDKSKMPSKKRSRVVLDEEKDTTYCEKRARNNESAKRSRSAKRIKEQRTLERVSFLERENLRLSMENQTIQYQISQLRALYDTDKKLFHYK